jgi:molecular chaperone DnaK
VSAQDLGTGKKQAIRVTASSGLDEDEIEKLVKEAEQNTETDRQRRDLIEQRNKADGLVYSTERTLEEFNESIQESDRKPIETALEAVRNAMEGEDCGALRAAVDELSTLTYTLTEHLYAELGGEDSE